MKFREVSCLTVSQHPHLDTTLDRLLGHILLERRPALELNHRFVILVGIVSLRKLDRKVVNDGTNFSEAVVSWRAAWLEGAIVHKVDISGDPQKVVSRYPVCKIDHLA